MSRKTKIVVAIVAVIAVAAIAFFGIRNQMQKADGEDVIKIGAIIFLTGPQAASGQDVLDGLKFAEKRINAKGGVNGKKIQLLIEDSKDSPKEAISAFYRLESKRVVAVICAGDAISRSLAPIASKTETPLVAVVAEDSELPKLSDWLFRFWVSDAKLVGKIADFACNQIKSKDIAVMAINTDFGRTSMSNFTQQVKRQGGKIAGVEYYGITDREVRNQLLGLISKRPDSFFVIGFGEAFGTVIKQIREVGFKGHIFTSITMAIDYYQKQAGDAGEGIFFPSTLFTRDSKNQKTIDFFRDFSDSYKKDPSFTVAFSYEALGLIARAAEINQLSRSGLRKNIGNLKPYQSILGEIYFDKSRELSIPVTIRKMHQLHDVPL